MQGSKVHAGQAVTLGTAIVAIIAQLNDVLPQVLSGDTLTWVLLGTNILSAILPKLMTKKPK